LLFRRRRDGEHSSARGIRHLATFLRGSEQERVVRFGSSGTPYEDSLRTMAIPRGPRSSSFRLDSEFTLHKAAAARACAARPRPSETGVVPACRARITHSAAFGNDAQANRWPGIPVPLSGVPS